MAVCYAEECEKPSKNAGLCFGHYSRLNRTGTLVSPRDNLTCIGCGAAFSYPVQTGPIPKWCAPCKATQSKPRKVKPRETCLGCGTKMPPYPGKGRYRKYCTPECRSIKFHNPDRVHFRECRACGTTIDLTERRNGRLRPSYTTLCDDCYRPHRYGMTVEQIADRDGSLCRGCNEPVDMSLRRPDLRSPSVDHIIPWSKGGTNDPENLQLMHLACNVLKGAQVPEHLLVGV